MKKLLFLILLVSSLFVVDGTFYAQDGQQTCTNELKAAHKCECERATTVPPDCPPDGVKMSSKCTNFCYEDLCRCVLQCDTNDTAHMQMEMKKDKNNEIGYSSAVSIWHYFTSVFSN